MHCEIRQARESDANAISRLILATLRVSNARDYPPDVISRVELSFSPTGVVALMENRQVLVALAQDRIIGTASLDGAVVRSVFVDPHSQGQGIGRRLMRDIEQRARDAGSRVLTVPSSVTAEGFYATLGFKTVRESFHGNERTLVMERSLQAR